MVARRTKGRAFHKGQLLGQAVDDYVQEGEHARSGEKHQNSYDNFANNKWHSVLLWLKNKMFFRQFSWFRSKKSGEIFGLGAAPMQNKNRNPIRWVHRMRFPFFLRIFRLPKSRQRSYSTKTCCKPSTRTFPLCTRMRFMVVRYVVVFKNFLNLILLLQLEH